MKLSKFSPKTAEIEFNDEVRDLVVDFAAIRAIGSECGNLTSVLMHVFNCAAGAEPADAATLATFYAAIVNQAGFRHEKRKIQPDMVYAAIMSDYTHNLPLVVRNCGAVAALMIPTVQSAESATEVDDDPKPQA